MSREVKFSRSEVETHRRCEREWHYRYQSEGEGYPKGAPGGYEPVEPSLALTLGLSIHKGMEFMFLKGSNTDAAIDAALGEWAILTTSPSLGTNLPKEGRDAPIDFVAEQQALIMAFLVAFRVQHWEQFNEQYEIVQIEQEIGVTAADGLTVVDDVDCGCTTWLAPRIKVTLQARCDLVVRERSTGMLLIPDWKVVKDARNWGTKFEREPQTWSQLFAVSKALNEEVAGAIYFAFIKGDRRKGQQCSPLVYGYRKLIGPSAWEYDTEYRSAKGWEKFRVWEQEQFGATPLQRIIYWVNWLPEEVRAAQFCQSPPVLRDEVRIAEWVSSSAERMVEAKGRPNAAAAHDASRSDWNCSKCSFEPVCYGREVLGQSTRFRPRVDHHSVEGGLE